MSNAMRLIDPAGFNAPPGVPTYTPKLATGITITDANIASGDETQVLAAGKTYVIMATTVGGFVMGVATTATAANLIWFVPAGGTLCFHMPVGQATLHFCGLVNNATAYIVELDQGC